MFLKLCILGFFIFISLSFIYTNYQSQITTKIERIIFSMIFAFMNHYFFTYFFKIFYISEEAEEMNHFWIELFKIIICSEYHYYILTILIGMNVYLNSMDYDAISCMQCIQIIYFFVTPIELYYVNLGEIMMLFFILDHCQWKIENIIRIFIGVSAGYLLNYFKLEFNAVMLLISGNFLIPFLLLIISYGFSFAFYIVDIYSIYLFDRIQISLYLKSYQTYIATQRNTLEPLLLILAHILLTVFYLIVFKILNSQIPDFLLSIIIILISFPIAFILSLHHYPDKPESVIYNFIPIFFEGIALNYFIN